MFKRRYFRTVEKSNLIQCDQTIRLTRLNTKNKYPKPLRIVKYHDKETDKTLNIFTNNEVISAQTVSDHYRYRWKVALFFKWIAISVYVANRHYQKTTQNKGGTLHNITGFETDSI